MRAEGPNDVCAAALAGPLAGGEAQNMTEETALKSSRRPVVVGVDGSVGSWRAVEAAAWEARQRSATLVLLHGYYERYPYAAYGWGPYVPIGDYPRDFAQALLDETVERIRLSYPDVAVQTWLRPGSGSSVLVEASPAAALLVVGARGHGGFGGLSLGSVAAQVAAYATCPVLVIRPPDDELADEAQALAAAAGVNVPRQGPIVVGVDGSTHADAALEFAFQESSLRRVPLVATYVWSMSLASDLEPAEPGQRDSEDAGARRLLAEVLAGWGPKYPDVMVEQRVVHSMNPSQALIEASAEAGLVVVGSRGRGGFAGLLLGSVGRDLVGHAHSPIAVVHDPADHERDIGGQS